MLRIPENQPLVYEARHIVKRAAMRRRLSNNSAEWGSQIQDALYNEHQQLNSKKVQIHWESKDDTTGNGVGRIVIEGRIAVPIIVENFRLAPLDTFTDAKSRPHRLNPKRMKKALFDPDLFESVISPQDEQGLMPDVPLYRSYGVLPWEEGRHVYASLLDEILPAATKGDLEKFASVINSDPQIPVNFQAYGTIDIAAKILNTKHSGGIEKIAEDLADKLPVNVVQFRFLPDRTLTMKVASDGVWAPQEVVLAENRLTPTLATLGITNTGWALKQAASPEGLTVTLRDRDVKPVCADAFEEISAIGKFGHYLVKDLAGREIAGYVFPQFYTLGKEAMPRALFLSPTLNVMQSKIAGIECPPLTEEIPSALPECNDTGCFVFESGGKAAALEPVEIRLVESSPSQVMIKASTLMGQEVTFNLSKSATDLVPVIEGVSYLLPLSAKFVKMNSLISDEILVGNEKVLSKMAREEVLGEDKVRLTSPTGGRYFVFHGPMAEKMGCAGIEQYPDETIFKLAATGMSVEDAFETMQKAKTAGAVVVGGLRPLVIGREALGLEKRAANMQLLATLPSIKKNLEDLVKVAADMQDPTSVDRVLALGFLNPQNIGIMCDHMDDLENTGTRLSEMLLAARMGAKQDLNESAIMQARQAIDDVLEGLANLRSRLGPQTSSEETGGSAE